MPDFNLGEAFQNDPEFNQKLSSVVGDSIGHIGESVKQKQQQDAAQKTKFVWNSADNTVTGTMDADYMKTIASDLKAYQGIRGEYDKMLQQNAQQQANIKAHPFANTLAQIAASIASQDTNPLTRGIGMAAGKLNPTTQDLQKQQMGMLEGKQGALQGEMGALSSVARMGMDQKRLGMEQEQLGLAKTREARLGTDEARKAAEDKARDLRDTRDKFLMAAGKGEAPPADVLNALFKEKGLEPSVATALTEAITKTNEAAQARTKADRALTERRVSALERGVTNKTSDKAETDKALEATAKAFASGDLAAVRDVASMRGPDRMKLFARIKELDPSFSMAGMNRKIDMEKSFSVGKDGIALQSFGTFLEHAGEVTETLKGVEQSNTPAFNKPMNWWKKNMAGSPEYQRFVTSLEPVGKEFESFLLNNRALYKDDRDRINMILSDESSPKQILSALNQMGKTAKDRYSEMNQRYKRTMGRDIPDAFGPEAAAAAEKIGIKLPKGESGASGGTFVFNPKTGKIEAQ